MKICYWSDGCWCWEDELEGMSHRSDDYAVTEPEFVNDYLIDEWVQAKCLEDQAMFLKILEAI
jgi:hypothetical protein